MLLHITLTEENPDQLAKTYSKTNYKRAKAAIKILLEGLNKAITGLTKGELKKLTKGDKIEVIERKQLDEKKTKDSDSILYILLFFDGLMMVNIDFVKILVSQAENNGFELPDLLTIFYNILDSKYIEETSKEVASHLLCGVIAFSDPDKIFLSQDHLFHGLIQWTYDYCLLK